MLFSSLVICYKDSSKIYDHQKFDGISTTKAHKLTFSNKVIGIALLYRKFYFTLWHFYEALTFLNDNKDISLILGYFNLDVLDSDVHEQLINTLTNFQLLSYMTHLNGTHIDQIYIFLKILAVSASVVNTYFSDNDVVRVEWQGYCIFSLCS